MHHPLTCSTCTHTHTPAASDRKFKRLLLVLVLILALMLTEWGASHISHSLVLMADAGHLMSDGLTIVLALLAAGLTRWRHPAHEEQHPVELLAALINSLLLLAIAFWIGWEALERLQAPPLEIFSWPMLFTATVGLGVNGVNLWLLHQDLGQDLNVRAVFLHLLADAASALGVLVAAIAVSLCHWFWADSLISLLIAILMVVGSLPLVFQSFGLLLARAAELNFPRTHS